MSPSQPNLVNYHFIISFHFIVIYIKTFITLFYYSIIAEPLLVASGHAETEGVDAVVLARQLGDLLLRRLGADLAPDDRYE